MEEPIIVCPKCKNEIKLTESLAGPLLESTRRDYEAKLAQKDVDLASRETTLQQREQALMQSRESLDQEIDTKLQSERKLIAADEAKKARLALQNDLNLKSRELTDLQEILKQKDEKLTEAQRVQAELLKKQRELDDARRELDLTIEKRVQEGLSATRDQARKEIEAELGLKVSEKEITISALQKQIDDLKRRAEQGSQQLQGEALELELEGMLRGRFPRDLIEPVPKGEHGGDVLQRVLSPQGQACGTILWESKRTRNWSDGWLAKLRDDQRTAKAEICVIISKVLPKDIDTFGLVDHVWVAHPQCAHAVAVALRYSLLEIAMARSATEGQQTKMEMVYQYLTGPRFRQRVQAIAEAFTNMKEDLDKERKVITKQWAKREEQIERVMLSTVGMYGDLQGIAGQSIQEIEGLELKALEAPSVPQS